MRKKIYLDLDDTVKDTERYIRKVLSTNGYKINTLASIYKYLCEKSNASGDIVRECLDEWDAIPYKSCSENVLRLLKVDYDVIFCTAYTSDKEAIRKRAFADMWGCDILLCGEGHNMKDHIDMSGAIFIDDRSDILLRSNASEKYELFNPYFFDFFADRDNRTKVVDWYSLVDCLLGDVHSGGDFVDENFRGIIYQGIQERSASVG